MQVGDAGRKGPVRMKKRQRLVVCMLALIWLTGCDAQEKAADNEGRTASAVYHTLSCYEAKARMEEGNAVVVDVREAEDYTNEHIPGAVNIPLETIGQEPPPSLRDKNAVLLLYCRTGERSRQAADKLVALGYTQVYDFGGILYWPYETEGGASERGTPLR